MSLSGAHLEKVKTSLPVRSASPEHLLFAQKGSLQNLGTFKLHASFKVGFTHVRNSAKTISNCQMSCLLVVPDPQVTEAAARCRARFFV